MKTVKIFKRTIPLYLVVAVLAVVTIAAAAFLTSILATMNLEAGSGVDVEFSEFTCNLSGSIGGVITECSLVDGIATISANELDNESVLKIDALMANLDTVPAYFHGVVPDAATIDGVSEFDLNVPEGWELGVGVSGLHLTFYTYLYDLQPNQIVDPIVVEFSFTDIAP